MSYVDAPTRLSMLAHNGADNLARLALLAALVLGWVTTLAWPPAPSGIQPRIVPSTILRPGYPLRVELPAAVPVPMEELARLVKEHKSLAKLDLDLPKIDRAETEAAVATAPAQQPALIPELKSGDFLSLDYDLAALDPLPEKYDLGDGSLMVKKPLYVDGASAGMATIRIEEGAQIFIATSALAKALDGHMDRLPKRIVGALEKGTGFIPFHELRGAGIVVDYDPVADRVSLSLPS